MLRLGLEDDGSVEREVRLARAETLRAALAAVEGCPGAESAQLVRHSYELQLRRAEMELTANAAEANGTSPDGAAIEASAIDADERDDDADIIHAAMEAQRGRLMALRSNGTIGDAAFQRIEEELDWMELGWAQVVGSERAGEGAA